MIFGKKKGHYKNPSGFIYCSPRYHKCITVPKDYPSDGATGALDVCQKAWLTHDVICDRGYWDDGTKINNWQASKVISDILEDECQRHIRKYTWFWATYLFGGGKARSNGMW
jgi:hypothetical protein